GVRRVDQVIAAAPRMSGRSRYQPENASTRLMTAVASSAPHHVGLPRGSSRSAAGRPATVTAAKQAAAAGRTWRSCSRAPKAHARHQCARADQDAEDEQQREAAAGCLAGLVAFGEWRG